mmetsp:Transcript_11573/g.27297  ORF Transcript_11573/g.27297 Transcript_11573/m.27297 type:complete len:127 (+) Transcript_11573:175-555(+)
MGAELMPILLVIRWSVQNVYHSAEYDLKVIFVFQLTRMNDALVADDICNCCNPFVDLAVLITSQSFKLLGEISKIIVRNVFRMKHCQLHRFSFSLRLFWTVMCLFCEDLAPTMVRKQRGPSRPQHP